MYIQQLLETDQYTTYLDKFCDDLYLNNTAGEDVVPMQSAQEKASCLPPQRPRVQHLVVMLTARCEGSRLDLVAWQVTSAGISQLKLTVGK